MWVWGWGWAEGLMWESGKTKGQGLVEDEGPAATGPRLAGSQLQEQVMVMVCVEHGVCRSGRRTSGQGLVKRRGSGCCRSSLGR